MKEPARSALPTQIDASATRSGTSRPGRGRRAARRAGLRRAAQLATGAALVMMVAPARAAGPPAQGPPAASPPTELVPRERPSTRSFYGWKILATAEAGGIVAAAGLVLPDKPLSTWPTTMAVLIGTPAFVIGGPATHWTHDNFQKGLISLAANIVFPMAGGLIGQSVHCSGDAPANCGQRGFALGFALAIVTVPIVDALVLGWEDIPDDDAPPTSGSPTSNGGGTRRGRPRRSRSDSITVMPAWHIGPRGELAFGVAGRF